MAAPAEFHAWAAGLFEGEGCTYICNRKDRPQGKVKTPTIAIDNTDKQLLIPLKKAFGGSITVDRYSKPPYARKPLMRWRIKHQQALAFAKTIMPYCMSEKSKAKLGKIIDHYNGGEE